MADQSVLRRQETRVSARVPKRVQDRLQYAADLTGATLNQSNIVGTDCSPTVVGSMVTGGTFTVPVVSGATHFYRLDGPRATKITNISKGTSSVVITYQVQ